MTIFLASKDTKLAKLYNLAFKYLSLNYFHAQSKRHKTNFLITRHERHHVTVMADGESDPSPTTFQL